MKPFKADDDRIKKRDPFENINEDILEKLFDEMQKMFENTYFKELIKDMFSNNFDLNTHFILDYGMKKDVSGKPMNQEFINFPKKPINKKQKYSDEREPPIDVIEGDDTVSITVEIPSVKKEDIKL